MRQYKVYCETIVVPLNTGPDLCNITGELSAAVERSGIDCGVVHAFNVGSTGSITTIEYEPGVVDDLRKALDRLIPPDIDYAHERAWHDGNGHSHVQAALMGPSLSIPVRGGALTLGTWQQAVLINHDNNPRKRNVEITVSGMC